MRRIVQVVNGRAVKDRLLSQAVLSPFRQALLPGRFPAVALFIEMDPSRLDVNVHPTKTEVRFLEGGKIFKTVESVIESMIERNGAPAFAQTPSEPQWLASESFAFTPTREPFREYTQNKLDFTPAEPLARHPFESGRFRGIVFNTYLIYDLGNELALIDQHAAHERVRYEKLRKRALGDETPAQTQALLIPEAVHFTAESRATLESLIPYLARLGFEAEIFGENAVIFRAIPAEWGSDSLRVRLKNLIDRALNLESPSLMDENLFEALASEACHSAVRAGDPLRDEEAQALVTSLFECEHPWNCPHGRPTVVKVPESRFEEWFQRRV